MKEVKGDIQWHAIRCLLTELSSPFPQFLLYLYPNQKRFKPCRAYFEDNGARGRKNYSIPFPIEANLSAGRLHWILRKGKRPHRWSKHSSWIKFPLPMLSLGPCKVPDYLSAVTSCLPLVSSCFSSHELPFCLFYACLYVLRWDAKYCFMTGLIYVLTYSLIDYKAIKYSYSYSLSLGGFTEEWIVDRSTFAFVINGVGEKVPL